MEAKLITRFKDVAEDGSLIELVIWYLPKPIPPSQHNYKYRLVYILDGKRVLGFDNERGKGDHVHQGSIELPYRFISVEKLIDDFISEVERWKSAT
jgi:hypothetical protein